MLRQPRKLHYLKCHQCRKDRQKCTPTDRCWPSRKCDRCIKFGYLCSPSVTARGELARPLKNPKNPQGKQPASLGFNVENYDFGVDYTTAQFGQSSLHNMENLFSDTSQDFPRTSYIEPTFAEKLTPGCANASCTNFFFTLKCSLWGDPFPSTVLESEDVDVRLRLAEAFFRRRSVAHELYAMLKQREILVISSFLQEVRIRNEMAKGSSRDKAVKIITADKVAKLPTSEAIKGKSQSAVEYIFAATRRIREANRWRELVEVFGAREILLIDAYHPKCVFQSRKSSNREIYTEFGDVTKLKCCPESLPFLSIDRIIKKGTDETFAKLKETLLTPELQLQVTFQRLSGLVSLIHRYLRPKDIDAFTVVTSLLSNISDVKLSLNEHNPDWSQKSPLGTEGFEEAKPSNRRLLSSEISSRIEDVFGSSNFLAAVESSDENDVWDFRDEDTSDEDISDEDTSDEDTSDEDTGDGDGDDEDELSGSNKEDIGFYEDFCIHFQNSDPFASFSL